MRFITRYFLVVLVFSFIFVTYIRTMLPSQAFHDAGEFQTVIHTLQIPHPTGFPTYILLGKIFTTLFPFGEVAWKANFLSTLYSMGALFFLWLFCYSLTKERILSLAGVALYAFVEPFWYYAGIADSHTLNRMVIFLLFYLLTLIPHKPRLWYLFCFIAALGLGNHLLLIYAAPGLAIWVLYLFYTHRLSFSLVRVGGGFGLFLLGLSVYLLLPLQEFEGIPYNANYSLRTWEGFSRHVFGGSFQGLMFQGGSTVIIENMIHGFAQISEFVTPFGFVLGLAGLGFMLSRYKLAGVSLLVLFVSLLAFSTNYPTSDPNRYFMSYVGIFCIWISFFCAGAFQFVSHMPVFTNRYARYACTLVLCFGVSWMSLHLFYTNYSRADKHLDRSAALYSQAVFSGIERDAVIVTWWNYYTPFWYRQAVLGERADVRIENNSHWPETVAYYYGSRPVYVVEERPEISATYVLEPDSSLYKVVGLRESLQ